MDSFGLQNSLLIFDILECRKPFIDFTPCKNLSILANCQRLLFSKTNIYHCTVSDFFDKNRLCYFKALLITQTNP